MIPEDILKPLIKWFREKRGYEMPRALAVRLYELLETEIKTNYASLNYSHKYDWYEWREPALRYAKGLLEIFRRLPKISDKDDSKLTASLYQLANISEEDEAYLYSLCTPVETYEYEARMARRKDSINNIQRPLNQITSTDDPEVKQAIRQAKTRTQRKTS